MSKAVLNSRIKEMKCNGKAIPQEYIVCFNDYIKNIIGTRVDQEIASLNKIIVEKFEIGKFKSVNELIYSYKNLEKEFTKSRQKIAELEQELAELKEKVIDRPKFKHFEEYWYIENNPYCDNELQVFNGKIMEIICAYDEDWLYEYRFDTSCRYIEEDNIFATEQEAQDKLKEIQGNE